MYEDLEGSASAPRERRLGFTAESGVPGRPPAGFRVVDVSTPTTAVVKDLASLRRDLELTKTFIETLIERGFLGDHDSRHPDIALWIAAVTSYGRAFGNGVRRAARLSTDGLDEADQRKHQHLIDLRNKHIAHSVSDLEQVTVQAYLTDSAFAKRATTRVGQTFIEIPPDESEGRDLLALSEYFLADIDRRLRAAHIQVGRELNELGLDHVYALPVSWVPDAERMDVKNRRT